MMCDNDDDDDDNDNNAGTSTSNNNNTKVLILSGEAFFDTNDDNAIKYCELEIEKLQNNINIINDNEKIILNEQNELKQLLYKRFGKSINLEEE